MFPLFLENKYTAIYDRLINTAQNRRHHSAVEYYERHHIIPKSLGGQNSPYNIVLLTAREHYIAHRLLVRMTDGRAKMKMAYALKSMLRNNPYQKRVLSSRVYASVRSDVKAAISEAMTGDANPFAGQKHTSSTRAHMSALRKNRHANGFVEGMKGKTHSDETKQKLRSANKRQFSDPISLERHRQITFEQMRDPIRRKAAGNGNRGKYWFYHPTTLHSRTYKEEEAPDGYIRGRPPLKQKE